MQHMHEIRIRHMVLCPMLEEHMDLKKGGGRRSKSGSSYHHSQRLIRVVCASHPHNSELCKIGGLDLQESTFLPKGIAKVLLNCVLVRRDLLNF